MYDAKQFEAATWAFSHQFGRRWKQLKIEVKTDSAQMLLKARRGEKRFAYAVVNSINNAAKAFQKRVQVQAARDLHLRKEFSKRQVAIIRPFASVGKSRPYAEVSVGSKPTLLLPELASKEHEERKPFTPGAKRVAVPIIDGQPRARFPASFPRHLYFKALKLKPHPRGKFKGGRGVRPNELSAGPKQTIWRGAQGTYMIPSIGVFQRYGSQRGQTKPIFLFDEEVPIPNRLEFLEIADAHLEEDLTEAMEKELLKEIARGL